MHRTRIKICGIKDIDAARAAADAGADMIGLVFVEKSPRFVTVEQAKAVVQSLPEHIDTVGLFVDRDPHEIKQIVNEVGLSTIQLHGHEPISILDELAEFDILKAHPFDLTIIEALKEWDAAPQVKALLFDTPPANEYALMGGSGKTFDWGMLKAMGILPFEKPHLIAGGLTSLNVHDVVRDLEPYGVDVSSGVESSRGVKDVRLIKAFCDAVRRADSDLD